MQNSVAIAAASLVKAVPCATAKPVPDVDVKNIYAPIIVKCGPDHNYGDGCWSRQSGAYLFMPKGRHTITAGSGAYWVNPSEPICPVTVDIKAEDVTMLNKHLYFMRGKGNTPYCSNTLSDTNCTCEIVDFFWSEDHGICVFALFEDYGHKVFTDAQAAGNYCYFSPSFCVSHSEDTDNNPAHLCWDNSLCPRIGAFGPLDYDVASQSFFRNNAVGKLPPPQEFTPFPQQQKA